MTKTQDSKRTYFANNRGGVSSIANKPEKKGVTRYKNESYGEVYGKQKNPDMLYSANKRKGASKGTTQYQAVIINEKTTKGTVNNRKRIEDAKSQLNRIKAMSDGSERHQQLVDRAQRTVDALRAYKSLSPT